MTVKIKHYDRLIQRLTETEYPETQAEDVKQAGGYCNPMVQCWLIRKILVLEHVDADGAGNCLPYPDAIRKFTALPAQTMHLADRGVLKAGMWADIVIFDPDKIADLATYANPNQYSVGMNYVLVNGTPVIADGKMTQAPARCCAAPAMPRRETTDHTFSWL